MAVQYRIRYVSNGGPVQPGNARGWPVASKAYSSLFPALKAVRDAVHKDPRIGKELGIGLQMRLFKSEPWKWLSVSDTNRYAAEMRIARWVKL